jgi:hypothetical protein
MQDFTSEDGRGVDKFTEVDYARIRNSHPERSQQLVIQRTLRRGRDEFRLDLDDDLQYLVPIALVCKAHGSAYYPDTVEELKALPHRPGNKPFRGALLAALLLMGDELDLHESRALFPPEFATSPVSLLHNYIHHYITAVEVRVGRNPKYRRIRLTMEFPKDSDEYRLDVCNWVVAKLRKQSELVNDATEALTQGELLWDGKIEVRETIDLYGARRSFLSSTQGKIALRELQRQVIEEQTVNRDELINFFQDAANQNTQCCLSVRIVDQKDSDWSQMAKQFKAICNCIDFPLVHLAFHQAAGHGPLDMLHRLCDELSEAGCQCINYAQAQGSERPSGHDVLTTMGEALMKDMQLWTKEHRLIMILEHIEKAESDTVDWLTSWLSKILKSGEGDLLVAVTADEECEIAPLSDKEAVFVLAPFAHDQIVAHMRRSFGFSPTKAELQASYLISSSSGIPVSVYSGLSVKRRQSLEILGALP